MPGACAHLPVMETTTSTLSGLEPLLSIEELAEYLDVPVTTIYDWRSTARGRARSMSAVSVRFATSTSWPGCADSARPSRGTGPSGAVNDRG